MLFILTVLITVLFIAFIDFVVVPAVLGIDYDDVTYFFYEKRRNKILNPKYQKSFYKRIHWLKKILRSKSTRHMLTIEAREHYSRCSRSEGEGRTLTFSEKDDYARAADVWALTAHRHLFTKKELKIIDECCKDIKRYVPNWREFLPSTSTTQKTRN